MLPDPQFNMRNLLSDPRVAILFLIPGCGETMRINGCAQISADPALLARFVVDGKTPKMATVVTVEAAYFQCSRAVLRADLWNPALHIDRACLPSAGKMLADITAQRIDATNYDRELPTRLKTTLY